MNSAWATAGPSHEIKIDESHRVLNSPVFGCGRAFYVALIIGLFSGDMRLYVDHSKRISIAIWLDVGGGFNWKSSFFESRSKFQRNIGSDARSSKRGSSSDSRYDCSRNRSGRACGGTARSEALLLVHGVRPLRDRRMLACGWR